MSIRSLPQELKKVAEDELNENPNEVLENIRIIKEWIAKEPHLNARTDDQWILTYLRGCKFSLQRTKEKIDYYYKLRTTAPEFLGNRDPSNPEIKETLTKQILLPLKINNNGPQSILIRLGGEDINHIPLLTIAKTATMMFEIVLNENDYLIMGQNVIVDFEGISLTRMFELTINQLKVLVSLQNAYPVRLKNIAFLNVPTAINSLVELLKRLLSKKLGSRLFTCSNSDLQQLYKCVPISILPKKYGGEASINEISEYWKQKMEDSTDWFLQDAVYGIDEAKRINIKFNDDYFGVEGSFQKIELD